jgi:hypothetical protein
MSHETFTGPARATADTSQWTARAVAYFRTELAHLPNPGPDAVAVATLYGFIRPDGTDTEHAALVRAVLTAHAEVSSR